MFDVFNDLYGYTTVTRTEVEGNFFELHGLLNITEARERVRRNCGKKAYFDMEDVHIGTCTGVRFKFMGDIRHWDKTFEIGVNTTFRDAEAGVVDNAGTTTSFRTEGSDADKKITDVSSTEGQSSPATSPAVQSMGKEKNYMELKAL